MSRRQVLLKFKSNQFLKYFAYLCWILNKDATSRAKVTNFPSSIGDVSDVRFEKFQHLRLTTGYDLNNIRKHKICISTPSRCNHTIKMASNRTFYRA